MVDQGDTNHSNNLKGILVWQATTPLPQKILAFSVTPT